MLLRAWRGVAAVQANRASVSSRVGYLTADRVNAPTKEQSGMILGDRRLSEEKGTGDEAEYQKRSKMKPRDETRRDGGYVIVILEDTHLEWWCVCCSAWI
jgi:hypothetical protein